MKIKAKVFNRIIAAFTAFSVSVTTLGWTAITSFAVPANETNTITLGATSEPLPSSNTNDVIPGNNVLSRTNYDSDDESSSLAVVYSKPTVSLALSGNSVNINTPVTISASAESEYSITNFDVVVNGTELTLTNGEAVFTPTSAGLYNVTATAYDIHGGKTVSKDSFAVFDPTKTGAPTAVLTDLNSQNITAPVAIAGNVSNANIAYYTLSYAKASITKDGSTTNISEPAAADYVVFSSGVSNSATNLGTFDPTLLENGYYRIKLTAYGVSTSNSYTTLVQVTGKMKIGNFSMSFDDIDIPVFNFPLTVTRAYDSRNKDKSGDFGYGRNLKFDKATLSENGTPGLNRQTVPDRTLFGTVISYKVAETKPHQILIDWGNGKTEHFNMVASGSYSSSSVIYGVTVSYSSVENTGNTLQAIGASSSIIYYGGELVDTNNNQFRYNPTKYKLTRQDGSSFIFNDSKGVETVQLPSGESVTITANNAVHSDGQTLFFTRDTSGRITQVHSSDNRNVYYEYDDNGDLVKLIDPQNNETTFVYDNEHYLTDIIDPRGIRTTRNVYDDNGRIISAIDANGNEVTYEHDLAGRQDIVTDRMGNSTVYDYDVKGNVTKITDALGNETNFTYDANNFVATETDAPGNVKSYNYNSNGDLLSFTDALGNTAANTYNAKHQLLSVSSAGTTQLTNVYDNYGEITSITDALGNAENFTYNNNGLVTSIADQIGTVIQITYNSDGKAVSSTNGAGETAAFTYDQYGRPASKTVTKNGENITENYTYDVLGNLTQIIYADGSIVNMEYDPAGFLTAEVDSKNRRTEFTRDPFGRITEIDYSDGTSELFTYDKEGRNKTATNRRGITVQMTYDAVGNLLTKAYPNGSQEVYTYDNKYRVTQIAGLNGGVTHYEYDTLDRNTAVVDPLGNRFEYSYGTNGLLTDFTDALENTTHYTYDANGRRTATTFADGSTISTAFDERGRIVSETNQNGNTTSYAYDGADKLVSVTDALGNIWSYGYDITGNLTSVTDPQNHTTSYVYDEMGRVVQTTNPLGNSAAYEYDSEGNLTDYTDFNGTITHYSYDENDRVSAIEAGDDIEQAFTYNNGGQLISVTDGSGVTSYTYDVMDGLAGASLQNGNSIVYNYDNGERLVGVAINNGGSHYETSYEYDLGDRLTRVVGYNGIAARYEYDANGNRTQAQYSNGGVITYEYDELNRLIEQTVYLDDEIVKKYEYTLGNAGEKLQITESDDGTNAVKVVDYVYDNVLRLVSETTTENGTSAVNTYTYDNASNRTSKTIDGVTTNYTYNAFNQLVSENGTTYNYDNNGNLTGKNDGTVSTTYSWDSLGRLASVTAQSGQDVTVEQYGYDYSGNRISKTTETGTTGYIVDTNAGLPYVLAETDSDNEVVTYYSVGDELVSLSRADETRYYFFDGHGDTRLLADEDGVITDTYDYDSFGNLTAKTGTTENDFLYTGEQYNENTGLYYLRARYMNPANGVFVSQDPYNGVLSDPVSLHKYLYANANPVMFTDHTGMFSLSEVLTSMAIQGVWGGLISGSVNVGLDILHQLNDAKDISAILANSPQKFVEGFVVGAIIGSLFGGLGVAAQEVCAAKAIMAALQTVLGVGGVYLGGEAAVQDYKNGDYAAAIVNAILAAVSASAALAGAKNLATPSCFDGDTPISTENGQKRIDEIKVGDKVWAYDTVSDSLELKEVTTVYVKSSNELVHLSVTEGGASKVIDTTSNHPFYVLKKGWVAAAELRAGDVLVTVNGEYAVVEQIQHELLEKPITVFNLEVEGFHSYFVGNVGLLVHNYDKTYETYTKTNPETGKVYSGRTSGVNGPAANIAKRDRNHHMNSDGYGPAVLDQSTPNYYAIRGREQQLIEVNGGAKSNNGTSGNAINGISSTNTKLLEYLKAANKELK
jgi:RHS repeat-associated protein